MVQSIFPATGPPATDVNIFGSWLLFPKDSGTPTSGRLDDFLEVRVMIGGLEAGIKDGTLSHSASGDDRLTAIVPAVASGQKYDVKVLTFRGVASGGNVQFEAS
jgi:hypothetical protein